MSQRLKLPKVGPLVPELVLWAGGSRPLAMVFQNRGIFSREEVENILSPLARPEPELGDFPPLAAALARIEAALAAGEKIAVYGDYDVDGITATALLVTALDRLGAQAHWHIPHRFTEGYGLDGRRIELLAEAGVKLIITCDCGVSNHREIQLANNLGLAVVVTDHHTPPPELPPAVAILNFKLLPKGHPSRDLPGVGTAFVLARALLERRGLKAEDLLDLVALGIIADVVPVLGHSRQLYLRGLPLLRQASRPGLAALFAAANLPPGLVDEEMIAFQVSPRLNAAGRLASGGLGVELLLAPDCENAAPLAQELNRLNLRRKELGKEMLGALAIQGGQPTVAYNPGWHQGIIGIAAGQVCSRSLAPAVLMTDSPDGNVVGSARSPVGIDIHDALTRCREHLLKFGGHPAAAGFSLSRDRLSDFCQALKDTLAQAMEGWSPPELKVDLVVEPAAVNPGLVEELAALGPCGEGNPPPLLYCQPLGIKGVRPAGSGHILTLGDRRHSFGAGLWEGGPAPESGSSIGAVFTVAQDDYRGQRSVMATIKAWWPRAEQPLFLERNICYEDLRGAAINQILGLFSAQAIYREGIPWQEQPGFTRMNLEAGALLVLMTAPPSPSVLRQLLAMAEPERVVLAYSPEAGQDFLRDLLGAIKFIIRRQGGLAPLAPLAAALAQTEETVLAALRLLADSGILEFELFQGKLVLGQGTGTKIKAGPRRQRFQELLEETAAFKKWLQKESLAAIKKIKP